MEATEATEVTDEATEVTEEDMEADGAGKEAGADKNTENTVGIQIPDHSLPSKLSHSRTI